ncbi:O-antigen ligase family protein [Skermanella mucosa]|uniref:O-antigen ligase family protein n=1 Tax=Skermanella mucosa TaxID=1789672 RepID=UPI00192BE0CB|nr:O-antigen ligase family protein [Skermanella mucosa]UEM22430.1 O-antigen ligase family protein [Skermanella mucosa]
MSRFLLFLAFVAFTLTEVQSPRFGDEERRLFAPFVPLILGGAVLLLSPRLMRMPHAVVASPPVVWLMAYLGWVAATTVWSGNVAESAFALTILVLALLVGIGLSGLPTDLSMRAFVASAVVVSLMGWLALGAGQNAMLSDNPFIWRFKSILTHEQRLALVTGLAATFVMMWLTDRGHGLSRRVLILCSVLAVCLISLAATQARFFTAVSMLMILGVMIYRLRRDMGSTFLLLTLSGVAGACLMIIAATLLSRGDADGTLTNRIPIWLMTLDAIRDEPIVGHGLATFRFGAVDKWNWVPAHAHNMWLNAAFENGWPAALLLTAFFISTIRSGIAYTRAFGVLSPALVTSVYCMITGMMGITAGSNKLSPIYGLIILLVCQEAREMSLLRRIVPSRQSGAAQGYPASVVTTREAIRS